MDFWTGIIVCFDEISTQRIINLQKILSESPDIHGNFNKQIPPHITFYEHADLRKQDYYDALQSIMNFVDSLMRNTTYRENVYKDRECGPYNYDTGRNDPGEETGHNKTKTAE